mgnify:CR=1 FL=1
MELLEHTKDLFKNGVELFQDIIEVTNAKGVTIKRDTKLLRENSLAAISVDTSKEWYMIVRLHSPVGTIILDYEDDKEKWEQLYEEIVAMCRLELTKKLLDERFSKSSAVLMKILEKRDSKHWQDNKTVDVKGGSENEPIHINIIGI